MIDSALATRLAPWGFDQVQFDGFIKRLAQTNISNAVTGTLIPPAPEDVRIWRHKWFDVAKWGTVSNIRIGNLQGRQTLYAHRPQQEDIEG